MMTFPHEERGSLYETMTLLQVASNLHYLSNQQAHLLAQQARDVQSKLSGLINYLKQSSK